ITQSKPVETQQKDVSKTKKAKSNQQNWTQKLVARLKANTHAMRYLASRSLKWETIDEFKLGLSMPYKKQDGMVSSDALTFPIRLEDGSFSSVNGYYCIPNVTLNPTDKNGWMKGKPQVYFTHAYRKQTKIFVCEGIKDAWIVYQYLKEN